MKNTGFNFENLSLGSQGMMVLIIQRNFNYLGNDLKEDGQFGDKTYKVTTEFQENKGLVANGIIDYKTMIEIDLEFEKVSKKLLKKRAS